MKDNGIRIDEMLDSLGRYNGSSSDKSVYFVALLEQELCKIRTVLTVIPVIKAFFMIFPLRKMFFNLN